MLTKQDFGELKKMFEEVLGTKVQAIVEKIVEKKLAEQSSELESRFTEIDLAIFRLRAEMKSELKRIHNDQNSIIKFFNEEVLDLKVRVEKLETLSPILHKIKK